MLLNYLYANFLEAGVFARACETSEDELTSYIEARIFPKPSYVYQSEGRSVSFVSDVTDDAIYRFHLKGHVAWHASVRRLGLMTEDRAHAHFFNRYEQAKKMFFTSDLGEQLTAITPKVPSVFDADHAAATWGHFLEGVYGVCTRDGQPESIFLKQVAVMFIEDIIAKEPGSLTGAQRTLLKRAVNFLDAVESDFAPQEVPQTSRQRCIVDVKAKFFKKIYE